MPKTNLKTLAYTAIRQKIVNCEYAPGTQINEELLTNALNLSRTPVRDALSRLEQEGLIEIRPKKGITVTSLDFSDINMTFEMRMLYEPYIILNYGKLIPADRLNWFYNIFSATPRGNHPTIEGMDIFELDAAFHSMIVNTCPNTYIRKSYDMIRTQNERFRHMTGVDTDTRLPDTFREHLDITQQLLAQDWTTAAEKMRYHVEQSKLSTFRLVFEQDRKKKTEEK